MCVHTHLLHGTPLDTEYGQRKPPYLSLYEYARRGEARVRACACARCRRGRAPTQAPHGCPRGPRADRALALALAWSQGQLRARVPVAPPRYVVCGTWYNIYTGYVVHVVCGGHALPPPPHTLPLRRSHCRSLAVCRRRHGLNLF